MTHDVLDIVALANPAPAGSEAPAGVLSSVALLEILDERTTSMSTTTLKPTQHGPDNKPKRSWLVPAMAGFVIVLVIGLSALLLSRSGQDNAPADVPPTTTMSAEEEADGTSAQLTNEQAMLTAESLIAAFNDGDVEAISGALSDDPSVEFSWLSAVGPPYWAADIEEFETVMDSLLALGTSIKLEPSDNDIIEPGGECIATSIGSAVSVRCRGTIGGSFFEAGNGEAKDVRVAVEVAEDGSVTRFAVRPNIDDRIASTLLVPFFEWVGENHPDDLDVISVPNDIDGLGSNGTTHQYERDLILSLKTAPLILEYIEEWKRTLP